MRDDPRLLDSVAANRAIERRVSDLERRPYVPAAYLGRVMSHYMALPVLRGFWPMSAGSQNNTVNDFSGNGIQLSQTNGQTFGLHNGLVPYRILNGTGYMTAVNPFPLRITGTSAWNTPEIPQGITLGCWLRRRADSGASNRGILTKYDSSSSNRSYLFYLSTTNVPRFAISTDGTSNVHDVAFSSAIPLNEWRFLLARWDRGDSVDVFVNNAKSSLTSSVTNGPLFSTSTADFYVGAYNAGSNNLQADVTLAFVCDAALPDSYVNYLYNLTRPLFT